jgi:peptidoglycan-N-acetylglucosamine deacetylase
MAVRTRLLLVLASLSLAVAGVGSALAHESTRRPLRALVAPPLPSIQPQVRFRPVGCERSGPAVDYRNGPSRKEVAVGFDDGPYPLTPQFARMLKENDAVATFFMIGRQVTAGYRSTLLSELRDGDALGDHTWSHPDLLTSDDVHGQLAETLRAIRELSGYTACVFRPPYGDLDSSIIDTARSLGLATVTWDVDPSDYTLPGTAAIAQRVLAAVRPGSIIISHDGGGPRGQTLAAYPRIIRALHARGYRFVTVPQLLGFRTVYRRCVRDCDDAAISGTPPAGSIIETGLPPR